MRIQPLPGACPSAVVARCTHCKPSESAKRTMSYHTIVLMTILAKLYIPES